MDALPRLVLASASPRRRALLEAAGIAHEVVDPGGDGPGAATDPAQRVLEHARHKARAGAALRPGRLVLAADTLVSCAGLILGKPHDAAEAEEMLRRLSGRVHEVWSGACLLLPSGVALERADMAQVRFDAIAEADLRGYLAGGDWRDKAGAYAVQGAARRWARVVAGDRETAVGLRTATVAELLAAGTCSCAPGA